MYLTMMLFNEQVLMPFDYRSTMQIYRDYAEYQAKLYSGEHPSPEYIRIRTEEYLKRMIDADVKTMEATIAKRVERKKFLQARKAPLEDPAYQGLSIDQLSASKLFGDFSKFDSIDKVESAYKAAANSQRSNFLDDRDAPTWQQLRDQHVKAAIAAQSQNSAELNQVDNQYFHQLDEDSDSNLNDSESELSPEVDVTVTVNFN